AGGELVVVERTFNFHPLHGISGHAIALRERIDVLLVRPTDARAEESRVVRLNAFSVSERNVQLPDRGLGLKVEHTDLAGLPAALCEHTHRLIIATGPDFIEIRP